MKIFYVYILLCADNSYYTGVTNNMDKRLELHQTGYVKSCYTFTRRPVKLVFVHQFKYVLTAIAFEKQVKRWSRKKKEALINDQWELLPELAKCLNESSHLNKPQKIRGNTKSSSE